VSRKPVKLEPVEGGWKGRFRCGPGPRLRVVVVAKDEPDAQQRADRLQAMVAALVKAGRGAQAALLLTDAAAALKPRDFAGIERAGLDLASKPLDAAKAIAPITYREAVRRWLSGEFKREDPHGVRGKGEGSVQQDWAIQNSLVLPMIGDKPIGLITFDQCKEVKRAIPAHLGWAGHRQYCVSIRRPFLLAEQFGIIERSPIGRGFVPPRGKSRAGTYLYPDEDRAYLACTDHPLVDRCIIGFGDRNGTRPSEAGLATWGDVDMKNRTFTLDKNKTRSPRQWRLEEDSFRMLELIRPANAKDGDLIFAGYLSGDPKEDARHFQKQLKRTPGVDRRALWANTDERRPICIHHAMRATFVTLGLASAQTDAGRHRTEMWIRDRTGHTTDKEMQTYRRQARFAVEHEHTGWLDPLHLAIPELAAMAIARGPAVAAVGVGHEVGQSTRGSIKKAVSGIARRNPKGKKVHSAVQVRAEKHPPRAARVAPKTPAGPPGSGGVGQAYADPEAVLTAAMAKATKAGNLDLVAELLAELRERRRARTSPDVVSLDEARSKRRR
jgi:integrase